MGRSGNGCFGIMSCGGGKAGRSAAEAGEINAQDKSSQDKRKWSFRKKPSSTQALSNILISDPMPVPVDNPEVTDNGLLPRSLEAPKKTSVVKFAEDTLSQPVAKAESSIPEFSNSTIDSDSILQVCQEPHNMQNIVSLQAVIRGHLIRTQAVGALCCIQSLVKIQEAARARSFKKYSRKPANMGKKISEIRPDKLCSSSEKLLENNFARQLLKLTPTIKPFYITSDLAKDGLAWKWLQRWTTLISSNIGYQQGHSLHTGCQEHVGKEVNLGSSAAAIEITAQVLSVPAVSNPKMPNGSVDVENLSIDLDSNKKNNISDVTHASSSSQKAFQSDATSQQCPIREKHTVNIEKSRRTIKRMMCEPLGTENEKVTLTSRKSLNLEASNEELSSGLSAGSHHDVTSEETLPRLEHHVPSAESSLSYDLKAQSGTLECDMDVSASDNLDSSGKFETRGKEIELDPVKLEKKNQSESGHAENGDNHGNASPAASNSSAASKVVQDQKLEEFQSVGDASVPAADNDYSENSFSVPKACNKKTQSNISGDRKKDGNISSNNKEDGSSPEDSPRSRTTLMESHGTPSSQISVDTNKGKVEISLLHRKQKYQSASKKCLSVTSEGPGARSNGEHTSKDQMTGKRRNSFGTCNFDIADHEQGVKNRKSLPSYMLATKSARAKTLASSCSPKSSPDVTDKESYRRKRHSLPLGSGKQDFSPRMQQSATHALPKVNDASSPHDSTERKWQR